MTQITISCAVGDKLRHNDVIVEKVINIDENSCNHVHCSVSNSSTESVDSRCELNSVHTADATRLDS